MGGNWLPSPKTVYLNKFLELSHEGNGRIGTLRGFVILANEQMSKKKSPPRPKHVPQRTCFVCRQKRDKRQLTRLVRTPEGSVLVVASGKQHGRGAYLCDQPACWDKVSANGRLLGQALKTAVSIADLEAIASQRPVTLSQTGPQ